MWNYRIVSRLDLLTLFLICILIVMGLITVSATSNSVEDKENILFLTSATKNQIKWFVIGIIAYGFFAVFDYRKLRNWAWGFYLITIFMLLGLFFTHSIHSVHRWYRIPFFNMGVQPAECAKLSSIIALSWFLEKKEGRTSNLFVTLQAGLIALIPFILILRQPDLGSAFVLYPITLGMFYFAGSNRLIINLMTILAVLMLCMTALIFLGVISHEELRSFLTYFLKSYQCDRFNPNTYHHQAAQIAIALGGYMGSGFGQSEFMGHGFLPAPHTDSVFPAFTEMFGFFGAFFILLLFFSLIYCSFRVIGVARDSFGRLLAAGISVYFAVHVMINISMMCGFLPITGVPLPFLTYGGSCVLWTMSALGILQSIYTRRFMF